MLERTFGWVGDMHWRVEDSSPATLAGTLGNAPNAQRAGPSGAKPLPRSVTSVPPATGPPSGDVVLTMIECES